MAKVIDGIGFVLSPEEAATVYRALEGGSDELERLQQAVYYWTDKQAGTLRELDEALDDLEASEGYVAELEAKLDDALMEMKDRLAEVSGELFELHKENVLQGDDIAYLKALVTGYQQEFDG